MRGSERVRVSDPADTVRLVDRKARSEQSECGAVEM